MSADEKVEILELVRKSPLSVVQTLRQLGIPRSTYYAWCQRQEAGGMAGLRDRKPAAQRAWNRLWDKEVRTVLHYAQKYPELSSRESACRITDDEGPGPAPGETAQRQWSGYVSTPLNAYLDAVGVKQLFAARFTHKLVARRSV